MIHLKMPQYKKLKAIMRGKGKLDLGEPETSLAEAHQILAALSAEGITTTISYGPYRIEDVQGERYVIGYLVNVRNRRGKGPDKPYPAYSLTEATQSAKHICQRNGWLTKGRWTQEEQKP